ncbi:MAG: hypothetical protein PF442_00110 [Desulfobulbaceae bacterium]|jgi:hypothetical protein|nr:hypothetical protein [Desulfobulbaceae bacterium]
MLKGAWQEMLVFCEDCGTKHNVDEHDVASETFQLRCDVCGFLITAKSLPKPNPERKPIDPTMELTCSHDSIEFGVIRGDEEKKQTLILAAKDGRKIELTGVLEPKLEGNVTLSPLSGVAFRVEVVSPSHVVGKCLSTYTGPGVVITDTLSRLQKTVNLSFTREG